jgi:hypothetical protein
MLPNTFGDIAGVQSLGRAESSCASEDAKGLRDAHSNSGLRLDSVAVGLHRLR